MNRLLKNPWLRYSLLFAGATGLAGVLFPNFVHNLFSADGFMPHAHCYFNDPRMIWLHVISDMFIGLAYVSISSTLAYMVFKASRDIPFHWMFLAFGLFIVSCGFTHFMEVWTVWKAVYWLAGGVKVITAVASVTTAIALFPLVPRVFELIATVKVSEERRLKLIAANRELEAFASSISHDLRAPLRTMQGMATALQEDFGNTLAPDAQNYTNRIIGASVRMDELISGLLAYSRVNLSEFKLTAVDLKPALEETAALLHASFEERGAALVFKGDFPPVMADRNFLMQVTTNLFTNAVKFVPAGVRPKVTVRGEDRQDRVRVFVEDNGIGIAREHQERIFKMFERLHSPAEYGGTGVGLAIVQRAVARMGGELGVDSEPGRGSCFWFELSKP